MPLREILPAVIFASLVAAVYVIALGALIRRARTRKVDSRLSVFDRCIFTLVIVGLVCMAYGYFVEPYRLSITHVDIGSPKIRPSAAPIRIVHFSDLHSDVRPRLELELPAVVAEQRPDVIVYTGDSINEPAALGVFQSTFAQLAKIAPTFAVRGNWDTHRPYGLFRDAGARELNANADRLMIRGTPIWIAGLAANNPRMLGQALGAIPQDEFVVLLYHYSDIIKEAADHHVDLYCAGHTHGGQVALPLYGALITLSRFGKRYEAGLFQERQTWLYVNRGIGMEGGAPRVRFWAPPELTVIDLRPTD